jgi:para-nitrobenzyl esterase
VPGANLPVVVYIPGGSFIALNPPMQDELDGAQLAQQVNAIVVTVAYRTNIFGFAAIPGSPTNIGLLDQIEAMRFVSKYIYVRVIVVMRCRKNLTRA